MKKLTYKVSRVEVPTFEMVENPTVKIRDVRLRRFDIIDRPITPENFWSVNFHKKTIFDYNTCEDITSTFCPPPVAEPIN